MLLCSVLNALPHTSTAQYNTPCLYNASRCSIVSFFAMEQDILTLAQRITKCKRLVVFSGAGMSKESGISTFRGQGSLWSTFFNLSLIYFGTPVGWFLTPGLSWKAYLTQFFDPISKALPNPGHIAIADLERLLVPRGVLFTIITQNVDNLHQRAGSSPHQVHELHGSVYRYICSRNRHPAPPDAMEQPDFFNSNFSDMAQCPVEGCGSHYRPDCILFGESLPSGSWDASLDAIEQLQAGDCVLVVGTSGVVYPAASLPEMAATKCGVITAEINPSRSSLTSDMDLHLPGPSGEVLPKLVSQVQALLQ